MTVHWQSHGTCYQMKLSQKPLMDVLDLALTKNLTFTSLNSIKTLVKMDRTKNFSNTEAT